MPVLHNMGVEFNDGLFEMVLVDMFKNPGEIAYLANSMVRKNVKNNRLVTIRHCKMSNLYLTSRHRLRLTANTAELLPK